MEYYYFMFGALMLGFFSAPHCLGMCGGIAGALAVTRATGAGAAPRWVELGSHNLGRLTSYMLLGALAGLIGFSLKQLAEPLMLLFRGAAGLLMIAMGLYIGGWWMGLRRLESGGYAMWQAITSRVPGLTLSRARGFASGVLWGFLPCGLVYTMLASAMATGNALDGALLMLAFGVGTLPTLFAAGLIASQVAAFREMQRVRAAMGLTVILFGLWTAGWVIWMSMGRDMAMG